MTPFEHAAQAYRQARGIGAHPVDRVVMVYDEAIAGCRAEDGRRTEQALAVLRGSLDQRANPSLAMHLTHIYDHCQRLVRTRRFRDAAALLQPIRNAWFAIRHPDLEPAVPDASPVPLLAPAR